MTLSEPKQEAATVGAICPAQIRALRVEASGVSSGAQAGVEVDEAEARAGICLEHGLLSNFALGMPISCRNSERHRCWLKACVPDTLVRLTPRRRIQISGPLCSGGLHARGPLQGPRRIGDGPPAPNLPARARGIRGARLRRGSLSARPGRPRRWTTWS